MNLSSVPPGQEDFDSPDAVFPLVDSIDGSVDVSVEQGRIGMREEIVCELTLATAHRDIDSPPMATLYAGTDDDGDRIYAEYALETLSEVRELRDALADILEYHDGI